MLKKNVCVLFILCAVSAFTCSIPDEPQQPSYLNVTLLTEITEKGQKINAVALEYESNVLSGRHLQSIYQVQTGLDTPPDQPRSVLRAYVNNRPAVTSTPTAGKFVIIELDVRDKNADLYSLKKENEQPMTFRAKDKAGNLIHVEKIQANSIPQFYEERLQYRITQTGLLKLTNGKTLSPHQVTQSAVKNHVKNPYIDDFSAHHIQADNPHNKLHYRFYAPPQRQHDKKYPLTVFLHGSGQLGNDNIAQLLSSKGAIATLHYEQGFVLAPQYSSVFDPFDDINNGQAGGIHWQTENRQALVLKMIDDTLAANPSIDDKCIYLIGLSRGGEGALNLLLKRPHFFAAALLLSGREAYTLEWMDGNATKTNLAPIKHVPMWLFHSKEDKVSPVEGSRINYQILSDLQASEVKYTEFSFQQAGDNGIINNNPHNTWDAVFNSPEVMMWLLNQKLN